jgi:hypothetical protein
LLPLNAKSSLLAKTEKDCIYLIFDFTNLPSLDTQSDRLQLVIDVLDSEKNTIKVSFWNMQLYSVAFRTYLLILLCATSPDFRLRKI